MFYMTPPYHLWYLLACIYSFIILWFVLRFISLGWISVCLLWTVQTLLTSYNWLPIPFLQKAIDFNNCVPAFSDTFFRAIPMILVGKILADKQSKSRVKVAILGVGFSCAFRFIEVTVLSSRFPLQYSFSFLLSTPFCVYYGLLLLLKIAKYTNLNFSTLTIRHLSSNIYYIHVMIIQAIALFYPLNCELKFVLVLFISIIIGLLIVELKSLYINIEKKLKKG